MRIAHQSGKSHREILVICHRPKRSPVAVNDNRLSLNHPLQHGIAPFAAVHPERHCALVIGMTRPDNCHWEAFLPVLLHKEFLACNFVAGVLPVRITECRSFRNPVTRRKLCVRGRRADVHVLIRNPLENPVVPLNLRRDKSDEVADRLKAFPI